MKKILTFIALVAVSFAVFSQTTRTYTSTIVTEVKVTLAEDSIEMFAITPGIFANRYDDWYVFAESKRFITLAEAISYLEKFDFVTESIDYVDGELSICMIKNSVTTTTITTNSQDLTQTQ